MIIDSIAGCHNLSILMLGTGIFWRPPETDFPDILGSTSVAIMPVILSFYFWIGD